MIGQSTQATSHLRSHADSNHNSNMSPLENNAHRTYTKRKLYASKSQHSRQSQSSDEDARPNKKLNQSDIKYIRRKKSYDQNIKQIQKASKSPEYKNNNVT